MKGNKAQVHAIVLQLLKLLLGKMQPCCWGGGRTLLPGVYGLIPFLVCQLLMDIWRQRGFSQPVQNLLKDALILEFDNPATKVRSLRYCAGQLIAEPYYLARLSLATRLYQGFPGITINAAKEENFYLAASAIPPA